MESPGWVRRSTVPPPAPTLNSELHPSSGSAAEKTMVSLDPQLAELTVRISSWIGPLREAAMVCGAPPVVGMRFRTPSGSL